MCKVSKLLLPSTIVLDYITNRNFNTSASSKYPFATTLRTSTQGCARNYLKELLLQRQIKGWGYQLIGDL